MATSSEMRREQTEKLYDLLKMKTDNAAAGVKVIGLDELIRRTKASMLKEDVAWVEKVLSEQ